VKARYQFLNNTRLTGYGIDRAAEEAMKEASDHFKLDMTVAGHAFSQHEGFSYLNVGDPYVATIIWYECEFSIGCWGDIVEQYENDNETSHADH